MDEYICLTILSKPGESEETFKNRLSGFWTTMLRNFSDDFERVYAETIRFEKQGDRWSRQYLAEVGIADRLESELRAAQLDFEPINRDDLYSKYEATPSEWWQIEH